MVWRLKPDWASSSTAAQIKGFGGSYLTAQKDPRAIEIEIQAQKLADHGN
jgi:hypothetical protein